MDIESGRWCLRGGHLHASNGLRSLDCGLQKQLSPLTHTGGQYFVYCKGKARGNEMVLI